MGGREDLLDLLRTEALLKGDFILASGRRSDFYVDARRVTLSAHGSRLIGELIFGLLGPDLPDAVGGMSLGADPMVAAVAVTADLHLARVDGLLVRKEAKAHGTGRRIEGPWREGMSVVVVEDTSTTGTSALEAVSAIRDAGGRISRVITLIDREEGAEAVVREAGLGFEALFTLRDIVGHGAPSTQRKPTPVSASPAAPDSRAARPVSGPRTAGDATASAAKRGGAVILRADGASAGNPGPAGAGYVLQKAGGSEVTRGSKYLGIATNNVAEYQALLLGLKAAHAIGATQVTVRMDSELVVKQMRGQYRVNNEGLKPLFERARAEAATFDSVRYEAVPREQNRIADKLATAAAAKKS